jgi:hypothetical protein
MHMISFHKVRFILLNMNIYNAKTLNISNVHKLRITSITTANVPKDSQQLEILL